MSASSTPTESNLPPAFRLGLILVCGLLLPVILWAGSGTGALSQAIAGLSVALLAIHSIATLGSKRALTFIGICLTVTFTIENIGVASGFPFGRYVFLVGDGLPHIGQIPIIVGALWFAFGYQGWIIACLLVGADFKGPRDRLALFAVPVFAAFVTTEWDLVIEPASTTIGRAWVWFDGGGYFGVPLSNFLGWLLTTWIFFQLFALVAYLRPHRGRCEPSDPDLIAIPILLYLASGLCHLVPLLDPDTRVFDATGKSWSSADIRETAAIVAVFTMLPTSGLAFTRLLRDRPLSNSAPRNPSLSET